MGYISRKYNICPKIIYTIGTIVEIILLIYLLSVTQCDIYNPDIRQFANFLNKSFNKNLIYYKNFDNNMSFIINFIDVINKLSLETYVIGLLIILLIFLVKFFVFLLFLPAKGETVNVTGIKRMLFNVCGVIDILLKTCGDVLILMMCLPIFSCINGKNYFFDTLTCYTGDHLLLVILSSSILFFLFINLIYQCTFFDVCNLLEFKNFGLSENLKNDFLNFFGKLNLILSCFFFFGDNQELVKICIYISINFVCIFIITQNISKFNNYYQNLNISMVSSLFVYSVFMISYSLTQSEIGVILFIIIVVSSVLIGAMIRYFIFSFKTRHLYAKVSKYN